MRTCAIVPQKVGNKFHMLSISVVVQVFSVFIHFFVVVTLTHGAPCFQSFVAQKIPVVVDFPGHASVYRSFSHRNMYVCVHMYVCIQIQVHVLYVYPNNSKHMFIIHIYIYIIKGRLKANFRVTDSLNVRKYACLKECLKVSTFEYVNV